MFAWRFNAEHFEFQWNARLSLIGCGTNGRSIGGSIGSTILVCANQNVLHLNSPMESLHRLHRLHRRMEIEQLKITGHQN